MQRFYAHLAGISTAFDLQAADMCALLIILLTERGPVCSTLFSAVTASPRCTIALCAHSLLQAILFGERGVDPSLVSFNRTVLLHGPPGTGKTTLCKALAQKLTVRFSHRCVLRPC